MEVVVENVISIALDNVALLAAVPPPDQLCSITEGSSGQQESQAENQR